MDNIYIGRGNGENHQDFVDFINYVFGFNGDGSDFMKILPKLYKTENKPCENNHVVMEDGKFKAAVGVFPSSMNVCGTEILCHGIGNVAVHPYSRSKGYMRKLMQISMDEMIKDGADISTLGGRRQRYGYYSFEPAGRTYNFEIDGENIRHAFAGIEISKKIDVKRISASDEKELADIKSLSEKSPLYSMRGEGAHMYDIMVSWRAGVWAFYEGSKFLGYAIVNGNDMTEIMLTDTDDFYDVLRTFMKENGKWNINITVPAFQPEIIRAAHKIAEGYNISEGEMFTVLNYKKVCEAFMKLRATYKPLADGELSLHIHGYAKEEKIKISVKNNEVTVTEIPDAASFDLTLTHREAMFLLFSCVPQDQFALTPAQASWLPLPLHQYNADHV